MGGDPTIDVGSAETVLDFVQAQDALETAQNQGPDAAGDVTAAQQRVEAAEKQWESQMELTDVGGLLRETSGNLDKHRGIDISARDVGFVVWEFYWAAYLQAAERDGREPPRRIPREQLMSEKEGLENALSVLRSVSDSCVWGHNKFRDTETAISRVKRVLAFVNKELGQSSD